MRQLSDGEILGAWRDSGSETAFARLVERHGPMVRATCARLLHDGEVDDAVQAVFMLLAQKAPRLGSRRHLGGWLHRCAVHVSRHAVRARVRRQRAELAAMSRRSEWKVARDDPWNALAPRLDAALNALPRRYRDVLVLCYLEGWTQEEASRRLGKPAGTIASLCARGLEKLRQKLGPASGQALSLPGLATLMVRNAPEAASPAWAQSVAGSAAAGSAGKSVAVMAQAAAKTLFWAEAKAAVGVAASVIVLSAFVILADDDAAVPEDRLTPETTEARHEPVGRRDRADAEAADTRLSDPPPAPAQENELVPVHPSLPPVPMPELEEERRSEVVESREENPPSTGPERRESEKPAPPTEREEAPEPALGTEPEKRDEGQVRLFARGAHRDYIRATYSFEFATRDDRALVRNDWDVVLRGGRSPADPLRFGVRMVTDDRSLIGNLGAADFESLGPASIPSTGGSGPTFHETVYAAARHVYIVHTRDRDSDLWSAFRVDEIVPGDSVLISWKVLARGVGRSADLRAEPLPRRDRRGKPKRPVRPPVAKKADKRKPVPERKGPLPRRDAEEDLGADRVRLFTRHPVDDYVRATFSFEYATRDDMRRVRNDWDIVLQGSGVTRHPFTWAVRSVTDDTSRIADLGTVALADVTADVATPAGAARHAFGDYIPVVLGHTYVVHTKDTDSDFWSAFRVDEVIPTNSVVITWKLLTEPQRRWDHEPARTGRGVRRGGARDPGLRDPRRARRPGDRRVRPPRTRLRGPTPATRPRPGVAPPTVPPVRSGGARPVPGVRPVPGARRPGGSGSRL